MSEGWGGEKGRERRVSRRAGGDVDIGSSGWFRVSEMVAFIAIEGSGKDSSRVLHRVSSRFVV